MTSEEVLAPPGRPTHAVRRVLLAAVVLGLAGWGLVARLPDGDPAPPATLPTQNPSGALPSEASAAADPPYPDTPLDGHWRSGRLSPATSAAIAGTRPRERLTLQVRGTAFAVWVGSGRPEDQRLLGYEALYDDGHRLQLSPVGAAGEKAVYRWHLVGDKLTFRLLRRTPGASASQRLVTVPFTQT